MVFEKERTKDIQIFPLSEEKIIEKNQIKDIQVFRSKEGKRNEREKGGEESRENSMLEALKIFSPGTAMRNAIDDILRANLGALIVIYKEGMSKILEGGFRVNCKFSPQRLVELAKMDGAIVLSKDLREILFANVLLVPKASFKSSETGTRHQAAERTAKQFNSLVVAVSERKNKVTIYLGEDKYVLESTSEILRRATETLQILEKQKDLFDDSLIHLNILEVTNLTSTSDVCSVLQRMEIIKRVSDNIRRYLVELGKEGIIVSMRLRELTRNLNSERELILKDYFGSDAERIEDVLSNMNFDFLLETSNILRLIFEELRDKIIFPKGYRILSKASFLEKDLDALIANFENLGDIFDADENTLSQVLGGNSFISPVKKNLDSLKEKILEGKKI
ncbi:MAG: DNA integrity scanning diadenylate cyclase DisA [Nanoarchaeota archaeon]